MKKKNNTYVSQIALLIRKKWPRWWPNPLLEPGHLKKKIIFKFKDMLCLFFV